MPIYEYICEDCFTKFEVLRPFALADNETPCKKCSSPNTRRMLSKCNSFIEGGIIASQTARSCGSCSGGSCNGCHH